MVFFVCFFLLLFFFFPRTRHWIAVFSLKMDRELNILIEHLATKLRPETGKVHTWQSLALSQFLQERKFPDIKTNKLIGLPCSELGQVLGDSKSVQVIVVK